MDDSLRHESVSHPMKLSKSKTDEAFETIFHEHWTSIHRFIARMVVDPSEAEDIALETFFRLHKHRPYEQDEFNVRGWLYKVAANLALQSIRSFKRRENYELNAGRDALEETHDHQPPRVFAEKEEQRLVRVALAQMNARQAELLIMRHSGMAYKDIAQALRLSPTSIGTLLLRAEREFQKHYQALTQEKP